MARTSAGPVTSVWRARSVYLDAMRSRDRPDRQVSARSGPEGVLVNVF